MTMPSSMIEAMLSSEFPMDFKGRNQRKQQSLLMMVNDGLMMVNDVG